MTTLGTVHLVIAFIIELVGSIPAYGCYLVIEFPLVVLAEESEYVYRYLGWFDNQRFFGLTYHWSIIVHGTVMYATIGYVIGLAMEHRAVKQAAANESRLQPNEDSGRQSRGNTFRDDIPTYRDPDAQY
ncbi:MAG: hypothetical protein AMXMBFR16_13080 [Candidatus Uhrbacteria bacterium]